jgi:hypothetical protein
VRLFSHTNLPRNDPLEGRVVLEPLSRIISKMRLVWIKSAANSIDGQYCTTSNHSSQILTAERR